MKKKAQILGLPLILVFSLIVGAFILLYGAKVILDLTEEADYVEFLDQLEDFDATLNSFGNYDVGSYNVYIFPQGLYDRNRFTIESFQTLEGNPLCISNGKDLLIQSQKEFVGISYYEK